MPVGVQALQMPAPAPTTLATGNMIADTIMSSPAAMR